MKGLFFTYALTFGGSLVSLVNPFVGLLAYICFAILRPESLWSFSVPAEGNYSRIIGVALMLGWALNGFGDWNLGRARRIVWMLVGFLAWMALASLTAIYPESAWPRVEALAKVVLPFLVGMTTIHSVQQLKLLAWTIVVSEGYVAYNLNTQYLDGIFNPENQLRFADLDNNGVAITMVCAAGLAFFLGLNEIRPWRRWLAFIAAGLMAHVVLFSNSRGGMVALIISGIVSFCVIRKQPSHYVFFAIALAVTLRLAGPPVWERFSTIFAEPEERDASAESRLQLSATMLRIMAESPTTGIGPGNFMLVSEKYGWTRNKDGHTTWLQVGAENGIPAMLLFLGFYLLTIKYCWSLTRPKNGAPQELADIGRMTIAALAGFMVSAQFVTIYGAELPYYVVLLGACAVKLDDLEFAPQLADITFQAGVATV